MKPREYVEYTFDKWWEQEQGDRMPKSKYLAKKAWKAAFKHSAFLQQKINDKIMDVYKIHLDTL
jgi:hypothetical protein